MCKQDVQRKQKGFFLCFLGIIVNLVTLQFDMREFFFFFAFCLFQERLKFTKGKEPPWPSG